MLNTCFPSESLKFWYVPGRACLHAQAPMKIPDTEFLTWAPGVTISHALSKLVLGEFLCTISWGKDPWKTWGWFSWSLQCTFFCDLPFLCFTGILVNPWNLEEGWSWSHAIETGKYFIPELYIFIVKCWWWVLS